MTYREYKMQIGVDGDLITKSTDGLFNPDSQLAILPTSEDDIDTFSVNDSAYIIHIMDDYDLLSKYNKSGELLSNTVIRYF